MKNAIYAQSGGVTAVINATACGLIETARQHQQHIGHVYAAHNGITGILQEDLLDTNQESSHAIASLKYTPGAAFGSCRYKLSSADDDCAEYQRLMRVFKAHNIGYFFYNGGNDSQDTTHKIYQMSQTMNYPLVCIGLPKTIDNDLVLTDNCPGFASAAKYLATSIREGGFDVASMAGSSTKVFIMEVMGRHAGWLAAATGLAAEQPGDSPHIILFPEIPFYGPAFLQRVDDCVKQYGYCTIAASEGITNKAGDLIVESSHTDMFGHHQLGGTGHVIANMISRNLSYKCHFAVADYLQRSARHLASQTDLEQAYQLGKTAIEKALQGESGIMMTIERVSQQPYQWQIGTALLADVANAEKHLPKHYISDDGFHITQACHDYLSPLIQGEAYPPYKNGLPDYGKKLQKIPVEKKLPKIFSLKK